MRLAVDINGELFRGGLLPINGGADPLDARNGEAGTTAAAAAGALAVMLTPSAVPAGCRPAGLIEDCLPFVICVRRLMGAPARGVRVWPVFPGAAASPVDSPVPPRESPGRNARIARPIAGRPAVRATPRASCETAADWVVHAALLAGSPARTPAQAENDSRPWVPTADPDGVFSPAPAANGRSACAFGRDWPPSSAAVGSLHDASPRARRQRDGR